MFTLLPQSTIAKHTEWRLHHLFLFSWKWILFLLSCHFFLCLLLLVVLKIATWVTQWMARTFFLSPFSLLFLSVLRSYLLLSQVFSSNHLYSSFLQVVPMTHFSFLSFLFTWFFLLLFLLLLVCVSLISSCLTVSHLTNLDSSLLHSCVCDFLPFSHIIHEVQSYILVYEWVCVCGISFLMCACVLFATRGRKRELH